MLNGGTRNRNSGDEGISVQADGDSLSEELQQSPSNQFIRYRILLKVAFHELLDRV